jgi:hypothetical protein
MHAGWFWPSLYFRLYNLWLPALFRSTIQSLIFASGFYGIVAFYSFGDSRFSGSIWSGQSGGQSGASTPKRKKLSIFPTSLFSHLHLFLFFSDRPTAATGEDHMPGRRLLHRPPAPLRSAEPQPMKALRHAVLGSTGRCRSSLHRALPIFAPPGAAASPTPSPRPTSTAIRQAILLSIRRQCVSAFLQLWSSGGTAHV